MLMYKIKNRWYAGVFHLFVSIGVALLAAMVVLLIWYPYPYSEISGGRELFFLIVAVDVVMGPLITLIIFNRGKSKSHLAMDFLVVGILQLIALCYGLWAVFIARPVHLVFEYRRMAVVHAIDIDPAQLSQALAELRVLPITGPTLLSLRPFKSSNEQMNSTLQAVGGIAQAAQPSLWQPYDAARADILKETKPVVQLKARFPDQVIAIDHVIAKTGVQESSIGYLPLITRKFFWTVLINTENAQPVGFMPVDSF